MTRVAVVQFPGSNSDVDAVRAAESVGADAYLLWHREEDLQGADVVILPGGFSYGDYLRAGAIAARAPIMTDVRRFAARGGPVVGICNGFQILCEAGLLSGALMRNRSLRFVCENVWLRVETAQTCLTADLTPGETIQIPVKHGEGRWVATPEQLARVEDQGLVVFRYSAVDGSLDDAYDPNGATNHIAGLRDRAGNVVGLMPHPEHAVDPDVGPTGGQPLFASLFSSALAQVAG
jgi:phosphoribosylformylglycinamidine synthase